MKAIKWKGDQDGRVGGHEHTSSHQHIKIHYTCEQLSLETTGNWQKDSCATKAVRKIYVEFCSKVREVIWSGPMPLRGDSEEKGDYMDGDPHWRVSGLSHILGAPASKSDREDKSRLAGSLCD